MYYSKVDQWHLMHSSVNEYNQVIIGLSNSALFTRTSKMNSCHNKHLITYGEITCFNVWLRFHVIIINESGFSLILKIVYTSLYHSWCHPVIMIYMYLYISYTITNQQKGNHLFTVLVFFRHDRSISSSWKKHEPSNFLSMICQTNICSLIGLRSILSWRNILETI